MNSLVKLYEFYKVNIYLLFKIILKTHKLIKSDWNIIKSGKLTHDFTLNTNFLKQKKQTLSLQNFQQPPLISIFSYVFIF
jgi:hypothetical protein